MLIDEAIGDTPITVPSGQLPNELDSTYVRTLVVLGENSRYKQLVDILDQVDFINIPSSYPPTYSNDAIEKATLHCIENYGTPTHLVEISFGCKAVFCIEDFKYKIMNPSMGAIICYAPRRNVVFRTSL
jgi:hypothetical protein